MLLITVDQCSLYSNTDLIIRSQQSRNCGRSCAQSGLEYFPFNAAGNHLLFQESSFVTSLGVWDQSDYLGFSEQVL